MSKRRGLSLGELRGARLLRAAELRGPRGLSPRAGLLALSAWLALGFGAVGCSESEEAPLPEPEQPDAGPLSCAVDESSSPETAWTLTAGEEASDSFCPRRDEDFWAVELPGGGNAEVDLTYRKLSDIRLAFEWFDPSGARLATVIEEPISADFHRARAVVPARAAGTYVVKVFDQTETEEDDDTRYTLVVSTQPDPDGNEPNDTPETATPLTGGDAVEAFFGASGDVDFYSVAAPSANARIVEVELRWDAEEAAQPGFVVTRGEWRFEGTRVRRAGGELFYREARIAPAGDGPFLVELRSVDPEALSNQGYALTVRVTEDQNEAAGRDDTPDTAVVFDGGDTSGDPSLVETSRTLAASGEQDWIRIDKALTGEAREGLEAVAAEDLFTLPDNGRPDRQLALGPFDADGCGDTETVIEGVPGARPSPGDVLADEQWQVAEGSRIDFRRLYGGGDRLAYLHFYVFANEARPVRVLYGADDAAVIWVNGVRVGDKGQCEGVRRDGYSADSTLNAGWNQILSSTSQGGGGWAMELRLVDPESGDGLALPYTLRAPGDTGETTLLSFEASADAEAPFLLQSNFYRPGGRSCSADTDCDQNGRCWVSEGRCLDFWMQLPSPDGPGDPQVGGLSPNLLRTQLPLFGHGEGIVFAELRHIRGALADVDGYSGDESYTLRLSHHLEPHEFDRSASRREHPTRPLNLGGGDFASIRRSETAPASCVGCGAEGPSFVAPAAGSQIVVPEDAVETACTEVTLQAFSGAGRLLPEPPEPEEGEEPEVEMTTVSLAVTPESGAELFESCTFEPDPEDPEAEPVPLTEVSFAGPTVTVGVRVAAGSAPSEIALEVSGDGLATTDTPIALLTEAQPHFGVDRDGRGRRLLTSRVNVIYVTRSTRNGRATPIVTATPEPPILGDEGNAWCRCEGLCDAPPCAGDEPAAGACTELCIEEMRSRDELELFLAPEIAGLAWLDFAAEGYAPSRWYYLAVEPAVLSLDAPAEGFISHAGDQDWFEVTAPSSLGPGTISLGLEMDASAVDIRAQVSRGGGATGFGRTEDRCDGGCGPGTCDTERQTCDQPAFDGTLDESDGCTYISNGDSNTLRVWVNDVDFNDWDLERPYRVSLSLREGCPLSCTPDWCLQD